MDRYEPVGSELFRDSEHLGSLQRDLLTSQLRELDNWCAQQRVAPPPSPTQVEEKNEYLARTEPTPAEELLQAQLREIETWIAEMRDGSVEAEQKTRLLDSTKPNDEDSASLILDLGRERRWAVRRPLEPHGSEQDLLDKHRVDLAHAALRKLRDSETQRHLVLEQARGVQLQTATDLRRLTTQLQSIDDDPFRSPDLGQYASADVAVSFVNAISQRLALARRLGEAARARTEARSVVDSHEHLLVCASASDALTATAGAQRLHGVDLIVSPAARLVIDAAESSINANAIGLDPGSPHFRRLQNLAEKNRELWNEFSKLSGRVGAGIAPSGGGVAEGVNNLTTTGANTALQSELSALRTNEGRLDTLLHGGAQSNGMWASTGMALRAAGNRLDASDGQLSQFLRSGADGGFDSGITALKFESSAQGVVPGLLAIPKVFVAVPFTDILWGWLRVATEIREWRRRKRKAERHRMLGKRGPMSWAIWFVVCGLTERAERPLPKTTRERTRLSKPIVRDGDGYEGTVLSSTSEGVCKVVYGDGRGAEVLLLPASSLVWLQEKPHSVISWVAFIAWTILVDRLQEAKKAMFRDRLLKNKGSVKSKRLLAWLAIYSDDRKSMLHFMFHLWRNFSREEQDAKLEVLGNSWSAWRQVVLKSRHSRAVQELQRTSTELHTARLQAMRSGSRADKMKRKLIKIFVAEDMLVRASVLAAWSSVAQVNAAKRRFEAKVRVVEGDAYARGIEAAVRVLGFQGAKSIGALKRSMFIEWRAALKNAKSKQALVKRGEMSIADGVANVVAEAFSIWSSSCSKVSRSQVIELNTALEASRAETARLHAVTKELYDFSKDADNRVQQIEAVLRSADIAMQAGARQHDALQREVARLEAQLREKSLEDASGTSAEEHERAIASLEEERDRYYDDYIQAKAQFDSEIRVARETLQGQLDEKDVGMETLRRELDEALQRIADMEDAVASGGRMTSSPTEVGGAVSSGARPPKGATIDLSSLHVDTGDAVGDVASERWTRGLRAGKFGDPVAAPKWIPLGPRAPAMDTDNLPDYPDACSVVAHGATLKNKGSGALSGAVVSTSDYFKVCRSNWEEYMLQFKGSSTTRVGHFSLTQVLDGKDWNQKERSVVLIRSDRKARYIHTMPVNFFNALLVVTREADRRRTVGFDPAAGAFPSIESP